jgi:hypothetical protein
MLTGESIVPNLPCRLGDLVLSLKTLLLSGEQQNYIFGFREDKTFLHCGQHRISIILQIGRRSEDDIFNEDLLVV